MPHYDFRTPRLFVDAPLAVAGEVLLDRNQANYLLKVLRLGRGDAVLLFNGRDGEWQASLSSVGNRSVSAAIRVRLRTQPP
jgi:16S rRNA (uracil1498-N3)-methyltransferase